MGFFKRRERNGISGKTKIYKTVEKYRKPGQTHMAKAMAAVVLPDTEKTGMIGVEIASFDGVNWIIIARLKDIYELHQEKKLDVINMNTTRNEVTIDDNGLEFIFFKQGMQSPNIKSIPVKYADDAMTYLENNRGF